MPAKSLSIRKGAVKWEVNLRSTPDQVDISGFRNNHDKWKNTMEPACNSCRQMLDNDELRRYLEFS